MTPDLPPCPFAPLPGRVVLADFPTSAVTRGGLVLPDAARSPGQRAMVVAVGEGVTEATTLEPGDVAAVRRYDGDWLRFGDVRLRMMAAEDVLGKWLEESQ